MTTEDFISELFYRVDEEMEEVAKHPLANLWPSEIATVGILFALKGSGTRAFYRWLSREGRSRKQIGRKGKSNHRWIVGGKLCLLLNHLGLVVAWDCAGANAPDTAFHPLIETFEDEMSVLSDSAFHAREGDPANLKLCDRGLWNTRTLVEPVLSMLSGVCHLKKSPFGCGPRSKRGSPSHWRPSISSCSGMGSNPMLMASFSSH